uniref:BAR domain-containing protein n=1 Tax=Pristionchus pacificus TaxID=54126 RepID=A0A8R1UCM1_PRIPA
MENREEPQKELPKKKLEKSRPNANEIRLQPLILSGVIKDKKAKIDKYKVAIDDLAVRMERVAQPDPEVLKLSKLNEAEGMNPFEMLANALDNYEKCIADQSVKNRLKLLGSQCIAASTSQRTNRDAMRMSMRHVRRFSVKEYLELHGDYTIMQDLLKQMDLARDAVRDCQDPNQLDRKALEFKQSIMQFEMQTAHVQNQLNSFDAHIVNHVRNVIDFVSHIKKYYDEPKLSKIDPSKIK